MLDALYWFGSHILMAVPNLYFALTNPASWLDWSDKEALSRFIYYGASAELFFAAFVVFLINTAVAIWRPGYMWACVRVLEGLANGVGRFVAWAGILMVLQQTMVVFLQSTFRMGDITFGFMGLSFTQTVGWWSEELKLYNALVVCLCASYTFVQGGHVRVDLVYAAVRFRIRKIIDMVGSLLFMIPVAMLTYLYGWFFMWRHLVVPKPSASDTLDRLLMKSKALNWNVETIGFSPNGFNGYFLFKILLVAFTVMIMLQAVAFFYRSFREFAEGEDAEHRYLDRDDLGEPDAEMAHALEEHR